MQSSPHKRKQELTCTLQKIRSMGGTTSVWYSYWMAVNYPIAIGVLPPSLQEDERDIGHGGARLREHTNSDSPDASASMPRLIWTSELHQQGPQSKIWPSSCCRRLRRSSRRWASARLLIHQEQVRNYVGRGFGDPRDPIALTCCAPLNP